MFVKIKNWLSKIKNRKAISFSITSSEPTFWNKYGSLIILGLGGLFVILLLPALIQLPSILSCFDYTKGKDVGDTIGGISGPFLSLLGAILVYLAFEAQIDANKQSKLESLLNQILNKSEKIENWFLGEEKLVKKLTKKLKKAQKQNRPFKIYDLKKIFFLIHSVNVIYELQKTVQVISERANSDGSVNTKGKENTLKEKLKLFHTVEGSAIRESYYISELVMDDIISLRNIISKNIELNDDSDRKSLIENIFEEYVFMKSHYYSINNKPK